jgi:hypothetical protein
MVVVIPPDDGVNVMITVPGAMPVTKAEVAPIVAIVLSLLLHVPKGPLRLMWPPTHTEPPPEIAALTVTGVVTKQAPNV